jgi:murein DD-endopeptidase MepM/ murein hydrolase activator NlpD
MKKISKGTDSEISALVSQLIGEPGPVFRDIPETADRLAYQLPVKHTKGGTEIDEKNKPWTVGAYSEVPFLRQVDKTVRPHYGVDLAAFRGAPIYPIGPGVVKATQPTSVGRSGISVQISHEDGKVLSFYSHLDKIRVSVGEEVDFNTVIGDMGDSGNAKGFPHLHYEVRVDSKRVNPRDVTGKEVGSLSKRAEFIKDLINKFNSFLESELSLPKK